jgi:hypothetical protein
MSLSALEVLQLNLLDRVEAGGGGYHHNCTHYLLAIGFALATRDGLALTTAGKVHLANLRSHVRDETSDRMGGLSSK